MKIGKLAKTGISIVAMGVAYIVSKRFGDIAKDSWDEARANHDLEDDEEIEVFDLESEESEEEKKETEDED